MADLTKARAIWFAEAMSTLLVPLSIQVGATLPPGVHGDWTEAEVAAWIRETAQLVGKRLSASAQPDGPFCGTCGGAQRLRRIEAYLWRCDHCGLEADHRNADSRTLTSTQPQDSETR